MASTQARNGAFSPRLAAFAAFALAATALTGALASPAAASSVTRVGPEETARRSLSTVEVAPAKTASRRSPAACAADFHASFAGILAGPYAQMKAAMGSPAPAPAMSAEPIAAALPGQLIFAPAPRPRSVAETAALRSAASLARRAGRTAGPSDANTRWVAARIREDLADFLTQKPSPFLCGGIDNYLTVLRRQADTIGVASDRRSVNLDTQRRAASVSLAAAFTALKPVPVPMAAPADRPDPAVVSQTLRSSVGLPDREPMGPPMLMAHREGTGETLISESSIDPDLPPLASPTERPLASEADILAAVDALTAAATAAGQMAPAETVGSDVDAGLVTGSIAPPAPGRPVLVRLAEIRPRLVGAGAPIRDPRLRMALVGAFADLEALDYLRVAAEAPADPLGAAMGATFDAIEAAHAAAAGASR
ncbi:hypothetical protein [Aureimonas sp. AU12]|uniref:hypothetical protein n=1 Tax=Aureimonas sp. AU12 TaxID=1638161 RepID=UPI000784BFCA|nr:hypothetical protein [Aureimonas sp. AU12]